MRISGISNLYGTMNTAAMRRLSQTRASQNMGTTARSRYGSYGNNTALAASKVNAVYEGTKTAAQSVRVHGQNLMDSGKGSLYDLAEEKGSTKDIVDEVKSFVEDYNSMVKGMSSGGGTMNELYASQLKTSAAGSQEALQKAGITTAKDGSLKINQDILGKADLSTLKEAFGGSGSFVGKASVKSIYVEANAVSQQSSARYSSFGGYNSYGGYSGYGNYDSYSGYGNYGTTGLSGYGSGYSLIGSLFNSLF